MTEVYFAFPDGVFDYTCARCTALCCRGQGFGGNLGREIPFLLKTYPGLESAAVSRQGPVMSFASPAGRCFFLDDRNLCRIEVEHGPDRKPGVCRLFPFNGLRRIGPVLTVLPHFLCPLSVHTPADPQQVAGSHARLLEILESSGLKDRGYADSYVVQLAATRRWRDRMESEVAFRDRCAQAIGVEPFQAVLASGSGDGALSDFLARCDRLLGGDGAVSGVPDALDAWLLAMAPALRLDHLDLGDAGLQRMMALAERHLRRLWPLSSVWSPQGVYHMWSSAAPLLRLLARADARPEAKRLARIQTPPSGDPDSTFAAFQILRDLPVRGVLESLERALPAITSISDRMALINQLGAAVDSAFRSRSARNA